MYLSKTHLLFAIHYMAGSISAKNCLNINEAGQLRSLNEVPMQKGENMRKAFI